MIMDVPKALQARPVVSGEPS